MIIKYLKIDEDVSKLVLWVSVGHRATELPDIKVRGLKKILPLSPSQASWVRTGQRGRLFYESINKCVSVT